MAIGQPRTPAIARAASRVTAAKRWKNAELLAQAEKELKIAWAEANAQGIYKYHDKNKPKIQCKNCGKDMTHHAPQPKFCPTCGMSVQESIDRADRLRNLRNALTRVSAQETVKGLETP